MQLERIRLKTFGCFQQEHDFELENGVNLIFGPNFSGKSTLVNAIFFALTGKPIVPRVDASAIRNASANGGTAGLQFTEAGERYQLYRATGRRTQLRCQRNGTWQIDFDEDGIKNVQTMLQTRFGIKHEQLSLTAFLREGEIFEFLARQPATRRDILHELLGIDRLIAVKDSFIETRRLAKREQNRIRGHQNSLRFNANAGNETEIERLETQLTDLENIYNTETGDAPLIAEWRQRQSDLQNRLDTLTHKQREALSGFEGIAQLRDMITRIEIGIQENAGLEKKREERLQQIGHFDSQINALTKVCDTLSNLIARDEQHCPTCHQQVEREVLQQIIDEKSDEKTKLCRELEIHQRAFTKETEDLENRQHLEKRLQTLQGCLRTFEQHTQEITEIQKAHTQLTTQLTERGVQDGAQPQQGTSTSLNRPELREQINQIRRRLDQLNREEAVRLDRLKALQQANTDAAEVEKTLMSLEVACTGVDRTIATLQREILAPAEEELHRWLERMELFSASRNNGGQTRVDLQRQHLLPSITIDGVDRSLMLLSGSEKMFLYLCFKVALARVLGNPGFFVLDDPTLHLDVERKALMIDFIHQLAEEHQVVVTSYDADVREGLKDAHLIEMRRDTD